MKKLVFFLLCTSGVILINAQSGKTEILQKLEQNYPDAQDQTVTATLKASTRLFSAMDDLTTVIMIIPSGSTVDVIGYDSTYLHVVYEDNEGYIFKRHAVVHEAPLQTSKAVQPVTGNVESQTMVRQQEPQQQVSRFTYLENKYGTTIAARLSSGKIWKGMNSEMVKDSWGSPVRINKSISGNDIKEEWIFKNTWLYFENYVLLEWGPVKK